MSNPVHRLLSVPVGKPVFLEDAGKSVQTSCRVHRVTFAKGALVFQAAPETMTATAKRIVWPDNVRTPAPLLVVPPQLSAGWPTIALSVSALKVCKETQRQNVGRWSASGTRTARPPRAVKTVLVSTFVCSPMLVASTPSARASDIGSSVLVRQIMSATPVSSAFPIRMNVLETHAELMLYVRIWLEDMTANARLAVLEIHSLAAYVAGASSTLAAMPGVDLMPFASLKASLPSASALQESPTATPWWSVPQKKKENASRTLTAQAAWRVCEASVPTLAAFALPVETMPSAKWSSTSRVVSVLNASLAVPMFAADQIPHATGLSSPWSKSPPPGASQTGTVARTLRVTPRMANASTHVLPSHAPSTSNARL